MDCELCDSLREQLAEAVKAHVSADDAFRLAVIRADGSSEPARRRLAETQSRSDRVTHEFCKHRGSHKRCFGERHGFGHAEMKMSFGGFSR
jgi:hypothetical protein